MCSLTIQPTHPRLLVGLLLASLLGACGGGDDVVGGSGTMQVSATPPPPASTAWTGHFVGTVRTTTDTLFGDAILTTDGSMRLYIGGPYNDTGALQLTRPAASAQFVGNLKVIANQAQATGLILGQQCAAAAQARFCDEPASAGISMSVNPGSDAGIVGGTLEGQIQVATPAGKETWVLNLTHWPDDGSPPLQGQFKELVADFATGDDTVLVLDGTGALFFQSTHSRCTGNGTLAAHAGGPDSADDATLTIANCSGALAYLNGEYTGLATTTPSSYWDYDGLLRVWLSKPSGSVTPAGLVLLAQAL